MSSTLEKGQYILKELLSYPSNDQTIEEELQFTAANNIKYIGMRLTVSSDHFSIDYREESTETNYINVYDDNNNDSYWKDPNYRYITIDNDTEVSEQFYNWFSSNEIKYQPITGDWTYITKYNLNSDISIQQTVRYKNDDSYSKLTFTSLNEIILEEGLDHNYRSHTLALGDTITFEDNAQLELSIFESMIQPFFGQGIYLGLSGIWRISSKSNTSMPDSLERTIAINILYELQEYNGIKLTSSGTGIDVTLCGDRDIRLNMDNLVLIDLGNNLLFMYEEDYNVWCLVAQKSLSAPNLELNGTFLTISEVQDATKYQIEFYYSGSLQGSKTIDSTTSITIDISQYCKTTGLHTIEVIASNDKLSSNPSTIHYDKYEQLTFPTISLNDTILTIDAVPYAASYCILYDNEKKELTKIEVSESTPAKYDLLNLNLFKLENPHLITGLFITDINDEMISNREYYLPSDYSNEISYYSNIRPIRATSKNGVLLLTANKFCNEHFKILLDDILESE